MFCNAIIFDLKYDTDKKLTSHVCAVKEGDLTAKNSKTVKTMGAKEIKTKGLLTKFLQGLAYKEPVIEIHVTPSNNWCKMEPIKWFSDLVPRTYGVRFALNDLLCFFDKAPDRFDDLVDEMFPMLDKRADKWALDMIKTILLELKDIPPYRIQKSTKRRTNEERPMLIVEEIPEYTDDMG